MDELEEVRESTDVEELAAGESEPAAAPVDTTGDGEKEEEEAEEHETSRGNAGGEVGSDVDEIPEASEEAAGLHDGAADVATVSEAPEAPEAIEEAVLADAAQDGAEDIGDEDKALPASSADQENGGLEGAPTSQNDYDDRHGAAAVKIQSRVRGRQVRARGRGGGQEGGGDEGGDNGGEEEVQEEEGYDYDGRHGAAAVKIQSRVRGRQVRARRGITDDEVGGGEGSDLGRALQVEGHRISDGVEDLGHEHHLSAVKIQSRARGMQVRRSMKHGAKGGGVSAQAVFADNFVADILEEEMQGEGTYEDAEMLRKSRGPDGFSAVTREGEHAAAVKIQSRIRGVQTRARAGHRDVDHLQLAIGTRAVVDLEVARDGEAVT